MQQFDSRSLAGSAVNILFLGASMQNIEAGTKIILMVVSAIAGITTVIYNIKKIKKL
jgi:hypothetical protein